jgi:thioesterase domain-containing protein
VVVTKDHEILSADHSLGSASEHVDSNQSAPLYSYLRPLRTSGVRPPLICFFPGPPGARDLAESLPEDQPVYEIFWPNMDNETTFPSIEQLASLFLSDIRKLSPHGPYQFCGYSTFGLVAYEMGQMLIAQGENVSFLALFDIWHPQFFQMLTPYEKARYSVLRVLDRSRKYYRTLKNDGMHAVVIRLIDFTHRKLTTAMWRVSRFGYRKVGRPVPKGAAVIESIAANKEYVPLPYPKKFILVRTEDILEKRLKDPTVGWHRSAKSGIHIYFVQGEHGKIKDKPFVRDLADKIAPHLAQPSQS